MALGNQIVNQKSINFLLSKHNIFKQIYDTYGTPPEWEREPGFETLIKIILEQQVSLESAKAHFIKLKENIGEITPHSIIEATEEKLTASYLSKQKKVYVKALANEIVNKGLNLNTLSKLNEEEIGAKLIKIKGIGNWTINIYLMMCLKKKDIFPIGDIALRNSIKRLTGLQTQEDMLALAEEWRPYRTLATYFLWHHYLSIKNKTVTE